MLTPELTYGDILSAALSALVPLLAFAFGYITVEIRWHRNLRDEVYHPLREGIKAKRFLVKDKFKPISSETLNLLKSQNGELEYKKEAIEEANDLMTKRGYRVARHLQKRWENIQELEEEFDSVREKLEEKFENEIREDFIEYFIKANNGDIAVRFELDDLPGHYGAKRIENWKPVAQNWKPGLYILGASLTDAQEDAFERINDKIENLEPTTPQELCEDLKDLILEYPEGEKIEELKTKIPEKMEQFQKDLEKYFLRGLPRKYWYYLVKIFDP